MSMSVSNSVVLSCFSGLSFHLFFHARYMDTTTPYLCSKISFTSYKNICMHRPASAEAGLYDTSAEKPKTLTGIDS